MYRHTRTASHEFRLTFNGCNVRWTIALNFGRSGMGHGAADALATAAGSSIMGRKSPCRIPDIFWKP